jgi:hypothetical protein
MHTATDIEALHETGVDAPQAALAQAISHQPIPITGQQ